MPFSTSELHEFAMKDHYRYAHLNISQSLQQRLKNFLKCTHGKDCVAQIKHKSFIYCNRLLPFICSFYDDVQISLQIIYPQIRYKTKVDFQFITIKFHSAVFELTG